MTLTRTSQIRRSLKQYVVTLIVAWIGVDDKKKGKEISSLYIASDSRYSAGSRDKFDFGIKVFGASKYPEIFGFCGDVLFPSIILGQIIPQIDNGILLNPSDNCDQKTQKIFNYIKTSLEKYPASFLGGSFTILHGTRYEKTFKLFKFVYTKKEGIKLEEITLGNISTKVYRMAQELKSLMKIGLKSGTIINIMIIELAVRFIIAYIKP